MRNFLFALSFTRLHAGEIDDVSSMSFFTKLSCGVVPVISYYFDKMEAASNDCTRSYGGMVIKPLDTAFPKGTVYDAQKVLQ